MPEFSDRAKLQWLAGVTHLIMPFFFLFKRSIPSAYYFPDSCDISQNLSK